MGEPVQPPAPMNSGEAKFDAETVQQMIDMALARQHEAHQSELSKLREEMTSLAKTAVADFVHTLIPEHAGGVGIRIAETWSQYEQDLARRGEHPDQSAGQPEHEVAGTK